MRQIETMRALLAELHGGAHVIQAFQPRWPGGSPREVFYLQRRDIKVAISSRVVSSAIRQGKIHADPSSDGFAPRTWRLRAN